jgi:hypothetical protein
MATTNSRDTKSVRDDVGRNAKQAARDTSSVPKPVHLHIVSELEDHALAEISRKIQDQYAEGRIVEHVHSPVRSGRELRRVLKDVEATPGIVVYSLSKQKLANKLEQFCKKEHLACVAGPKPELGKESRASGWFQAAIIASLAIVLFWAIGTKSLVPYLTDSNAEPNTRLPIATADELVNSAAAKLDPINKRVSEQARAEDQRDSMPDENVYPPLTVSAADSESLIEIESQLQSALQKDPLHARALNLLGQVAQLRGDNQKTEHIMQAAAHRSLHNYYPAYWMLLKSYEDQDFALAVYYADALLRASGGSVESVVRILARIAETPEGSAELERVLKENPPWRLGFFQALKRNITDARTPLNLFLSLEDTPAAATPKERSTYNKFLVKRGLYELAYYTWLQFLPEEQLGSLGGLFNGDFEIPLTAEPFDWRFRNQAGAIVEVTSHPDDDGHVLFMKLGPGRVNLGDVSQLVVLPPGRYKFRGLQKVDILSKKPFFWEVRCVGAPGASASNEEPLGKGPAIEGRDLSWSGFEFDFTVPRTDCPAQYARLSSDARAASDQFMNGSVWFDELEILRESVDQS